VSALFALEGRSSRKHQAVEAAVHRDLVRAGLWPEPLGRAYSRLVERREVGHYGGPKHVCEKEAEEAIRMASDILGAVEPMRPAQFRRSEEGPPP